MKNQDLISIYTDGAYSPLRKKGGIGIVILKNNEKLFEFSHKFERTTNNQMELIAVIVALRFIKEEYESITIFTDSQYVIGGATLGWKRNKNQNLWNKLDEQLERLSNVKFEHVKGHNTNVWNNYVDNLAVKASHLL